MVSLQFSKEKIWRNAERALKRTREYREHVELEYDDNYQLDYILVKSGKPVSDGVMAYAGYEENVILFYPYDENADPTSLWGFNYERDLFEALGNGEEIVGMTLECHYNVWCTIEEWKDEIEEKEGLQKYLNYCKRNGITKEKLGEVLSYNGMDVMTLYGSGKEVEKEKMRSKKGQER